MAIRTNASIACRAKPLSSLLRGSLAAIGLGVLLTSGIAGAASPASITQGLVLNGVTIVDTHDGTLARGMAIVIDGGKITKIVRTKDVTVGGSAKSVDARGKFVVPGYLDMHAHPLNSSDPQGSLTLMLANGITGYRQMSGTPEDLEQRRQGKHLTATDEPALLAMPGTILTRANAGSPEAAVAEVQKQKAMGADFIKVVDVAPDAFFAALKEAKRLGLPFVGHLPSTVNVADAARSGMRSIEHLGPRDSVLLGCSTDEAALRREIEQTPPRAPPIVPGPGLAELVERALANPIMFTNPSEFARYQHVVDTYSEAKCRRLAAQFVADGTWQVPTLIRVRTMEFGDDPQYRNDANLRYMPPSTRQMWEGLAQQFPARIPPAAKETLKQLFALQLKLVKLFEQTGVKMLAGSDLGGGWVIPGFGLHQEFDLLAQAGISPLEVLQMTTLNGAKFLGRERSMGSVERGKDADLVLLDANPVASVQNLHRVHAVIRGGAYYSGDALSDMKKRTEERQADAGASGAPRQQ
jgi:imidazolonepropionase-like amidohydrolase